VPQIIQKRLKVVGSIRKVPGRGDSDISSLPGCPFLLLLDVPWPQAQTPGCSLGILPGQSLQSHSLHMWEQSDGTRYTSLSS
jgi:hypothetical protein